MSSFICSFLLILLLYSVFNDHFLCLTSVKLVGSSGLEPPTSRLSGARSNHLSYEPIKLFDVSRLSRLFFTAFSPLVEMMGIEPMTPCLQGRCSPSWATPPYLGIQFPFGHWKLNNNRDKHLALHRAPFLSSLILLRYDTSVKMCPCLHRKEVIQPHLPIRLPCYDLTPVIESTLDSCLLAVSSLALGVPNSHGLTGGVYKARERIHRGMLIRDY